MPHIVIPSLRLIKITGLLCATVLWVGCARAPQESFAPAASLADLPELHQQNIREALRKMFGTPTATASALSIVEEEDAEAAADEAEAEDEQPPEDELLPGAHLTDAAHLRHGAQVYKNRCSGCHGVTGNGQGAAADYLQPKPRDYRQGIYKFTSTPYGYRPVRQDLVRTIRRGAKGTSMPAFPWLSQEDLEAVIDYVIYLTLRGRVEEYVVTMSEDYDEDEAIDRQEFTDAIEDELARWNQANDQIVRAATAEPAYDEASVRLGRELFIKSSCYQCHGADAKGQTEWLSAEFLAAQEAAPVAQQLKINYDAWGYAAPAADITARMLHGGRRPIDIYRRIYTGINGTPMPAFGDVFADNQDAIWHLVHYVRHIIEGGDPTLDIGVEDVTKGTSSDGSA